MKEARLGTVCESVCPAATGVQSLRMPHIPSLPRRSVPPNGAVRALPATLLPAPFSCRPRREGSGDVESVESKSRAVGTESSREWVYTVHTTHSPSGVLLHDTLLVNSNSSSESVVSARYPYVGLCSSVIVR